MTADSGFPVLALPPENVSALVVGLEKYKFTGSGTDLPGAARSAARFASWLATQYVCLPERITLMTTGGQVTDEIAGQGIRHVKTAEADADFTEWINDHGPAKDDRLFVLFWVGHGFAYPDDAYERLALLGSDADRRRLRHVELKDLLYAATGVAPGADVVAFVSACRAPVEPSWERRLENGFERLATEQGEGVTRTGKRFVVYAAAHGQTTKMAGEENITFADYLLGRVETLRPGQGPIDIFGADLEAFVKTLSWEQAGPHWTTYGYSDGRGDHTLPPPPNDQELKWDEWQHLVRIAAAIDGAPDTAPMSVVRWGAYYHAVDLNEGEHRPRLRNITDLVTTLWNRRPREGQAPPLVIACDYVANLPTKNCRPDLDEWCAKWAGIRGGDDVARLDLARWKRPDSLPDRPYLSITVDDYFDASPGRYQLKPVLSAIGQPSSRPPRGPVTEGQIPSAIRAVVNEAVATGMLSDLDDLLVEVVLPHRLVRRGWRPEYMRPEHLGIEHAVVIRDLDVARGVGEYGATARTRARKTFKAMAGYVPRGDSGWSGKIRWFTCEEAWEPTLGEILLTLRNRDKFCIGLGRTKEPRSRGNGSPMGFIDSVERGAAIIISMQHAGGCRSCLQAAGEAGRTCEVLREKGRVIDKVKESPNGLLDLPYILRDIRTDLGLASQLHLGVYMEDPSRLWWDHLQSQYRSPGSKDSEKGQ